jgi:hypothetical protein
MAGRVEFKYLVPNALLDQIRSDLRPYTELDPFAGKSASSEYTVRSVYYDTPRFDCYEAKLAGLNERKKFRIRGYDRPEESSIVFLEIKQKFQDFIAKNRAPLLHKDLNAFLSSPDFEKHIIPLSGTDVEKSDAQRFMYHYCRYGLRPAALVVYDREAFLGKFDPSLRLTVDKNLRGALLPGLDMLYDDECLQYAMRRCSTFEVKFFRRALPAWVVAIIERYELPRQALSKYTICMESLRAPRNPTRMRSLLPSALDALQAPANASQARNREIIRVSNSA